MLVSPQLLFVNVLGDKCFRVIYKISPVTRIAPYVSKRIRYHISEQSPFPPPPKPLPLNSSIKFDRSPWAKVVGASVIQRTRGSQITLRSETSLSSCSTLGVDDEVASFSWSLIAANESRASAREFTVEAGRDPRVLAISPFTLGYAGSSYTFQFRSSFGPDMRTTANATSELSVVGELHRVSTDGFCELEGLRSSRDFWSSSATDPVETRNILYFLHSTHLLL